MTPEGTVLVSKIMDLFEGGSTKEMAEHGKELAIQLQQDMETRDLGIVLYGMCVNWLQLIEENWKLVQATEGPEMQALLAKYKAEQQV